jgi:hypothetical protein
MLMSRPPPQWTGMPPAQLADLLIGAIRDFVPLPAHGAFDLAARVS